MDSISERRMMLLVQMNWGQEHFLLLYVPKFTKQFPIQPKTKVLKTQTAALPTKT
jgi:hypothetical protein